jgi:hypothetical protein
MATVNRIEKKAVMAKWDIIKFQILTYCYLNRIAVSDSELNCITLLAFNQPIELTSFCYDISDETPWIYKTSQSARNALRKCEKKGLIIKDPNQKKNVLVNPLINLKREGNILYELKFLAKDDSEKV